MCINLRLHMRWLTTPDCDDGYLKSRAVLNTRRSRRRNFRLIQARLPGAESVITAAAPGQSIEFVAVLEGDQMRRHDRISSELSKVQSVDQRMRLE